MNSLNHLLSRVLPAALLSLGLCSCAGLPYPAGHPSRTEAAAETPSDRGSANLEGATPNPEGETVAATGGARRWTPLQLGLWESGQVFPPSSDVIGLRFNFLGGRNRELTGLDVGVLYNRIDSDLLGLQVAAFSNVAEGDSVGVQLAPLAGNRSGFMPKEGEARGSLLGAQLGGKNVAADLLGLQVGLGNNSGRHRGLQSAVWSNSCRLITGLQVALYNHAERGTGIRIGGVATGRSWSGLQLSLWNGADSVGSAATEMTGVQAGLVNLTNDITGFQVGAIHNSSSLGTGVQLGFWNVAKILHGVQVGIINSADQLSGLQIGLWNVNPAGWITMCPLLNMSVQ